MSYIKDEFVLARVEWRDKQKTFGGSSTPDTAFNEGMAAGFEIALRAYGIWKDGKQVIGCADTPIAQVLKEETP